ncbi:MAG: heparan-alpha-glucosaminide N-acetyltransferase domain-containing protein [Bacteroidales bacterium]|nr:heparan-alpha-glucosaminide N-acetyltransferase domain-containing protein [Bacteroidales bacterium]
MKRIQALDILRGITIAGMLLVNNPGSWSYIYAPLRHAEWNGLTPTDLVFPFFMFIMGISTYISLRKYDFAYSHATARKILRRTAVIFLVGVAVGWFSRFCNYWHHANPDLGFWGCLWEASWTFDRMRILGVLQRLALCYGVVSILAITVKHRYFPYIMATLLLGYAVLLLGFDGYVYDGSVNILGRVDAAILTPAHMYKDHSIEPEGLLSTLPSIAHVMLGFCVGRMMLQCREDVSAQAPGPDYGRLMLNLFIVGTILLFAGFLLSYGLPINKKIWSPTFVLVTCGFASSALALLIWVIDVRGWKRWSVFFESFGVNPLFMYIMGSVLAILLGAVRLPWGDATMSIHNILYKECLAPVFGQVGGSLAYALLFDVLVWCIGYPLYKRKIYIKI